MNKLVKVSLYGAIFSTLLAPTYVTHAMDASDNNIVVVTASKRAETIKNSPAAVQVITQADMKRLGADTVAFKVHYNWLTILIYQKQG